MYNISYNFITICIPIIIICYCYYKVTQTVKKMYGFAISASQLRSNSLKMFGYVAIPILCFLPGIVSDLIFSFQGTYYNLEAQIITSIARRSWSFLNLLAYWFLNLPEHHKKRDSVIGDEVPDFSLSLMNMNKK